ncbi:hypothetical protein pb186bvf_010370 [Paramecium bursaria]
MDQIEDPLIEGRARLQTLDFNASLKGNVPQQHRFSSTKLKNELEQYDSQEWSKRINLDQGYFKYPSDLAQAELHRQCHYLQPDKEFLDSTDATECPCCKKQLRRNRVSTYFVDLYDYLSNEYGITIPLHFTFLKVQLFILTLFFLVYGIFFILEVKYLCGLDLKIKCKDPNFEFCDQCQFSSFYSFIDLGTLQDLLKNYEQNENNEPWKWKYFQFAAFFIFLINIFMPFVYETIIRYNQVKYWDKEPVNHLNENKKSIYVKHLPYKMTQNEIHQTIQRALALDTNKLIAKKSFLFEKEASITELVYVYDIHEITEMNITRERQFLDLLVTIQQIKELKEANMIRTFKPEQIRAYQTFTIELLENLFKQQMKELVFQTNKIKLYLKNGLPFTNKILIKFASPEQRTAVYLHYKKTWYQNLLIRYEVLKQEQRELKAKQRVSDTFEYPENAASSYDSQDHEQDTIAQAKMKEEQQAPTILAQLQDDYSDKYIEQVHHQLRVQRGFRVDEVNWENLGMNTLKRFQLRLRTLIITLVTCVLMMGGFEFIYVYQHNPDMLDTKSKGNLSTTQKVLTYIMTVLITVFSSYATLTILGNMAKSRRITYSDLEENIMNFMIFIQNILITFFPYIMTIEFWDGFNRVVPIYDLISLSLSRLIFKDLYHTIHLRHTKYWLQKRKILKAFNPMLYFQGQLNQLMTPPEFPQRGRTLAIFFMTTMASTMIYFCPVLEVICIGFLIYLYIFDRNAILTHYQIDKKFNLEHLSYFVKAFQVIVTPMNIYMYMRLFWGSGMCVYVGAPLSIIVVITLIFLKRRIVNFIVFSIFKQKKKMPAKQFVERPFFESYNNHFQNLRIETLTEILAKIYKSEKTMNDSVSSEI